MMFRNRHRRSFSSFCSSRNTIPSTPASLIFTCCWSQLHQTFVGNHDMIWKTCLYNYFILKASKHRSFRSCSVVCSRLLQSALLSSRVFLQALHYTASPSNHFLNFEKLTLLYNTFKNCCSQPLSAAPPSRLNILLILKTCNTDLPVGNRGHYSCP